MNKVIKYKWIEALRSGEYKQGTVFLESDGCYCVMGVLCELYNKNSSKKVNLTNLSLMPEEVASWAGLDTTLGFVTLPRYYSSNGETLSTYNDRGFDFAWLSHLIEEAL